MSDELNDIKPGEVPDYHQLTISRDEIIADLVRRHDFAEQVINLGNMLRSNLYKAAKKCGISKDEIARARFKNHISQLDESLLDGLDPSDIDKVK